jgi:hypothetical protein
MKLVRVIIDVIISNVSLSTPADESITQQWRAVCSGFLLLSRAQMLLEGVKGS